MPDRGDPDRWHRLSDLFHQALECDPDRRGLLLDEACRGDSALRDEVESLLAFHDQSHGLMDTPTHLAAGGQSNGATGNALVGHTLNQYSVTKKLGEGGMGVVYLAEDTRLGRQVALKALGAHFSRNDERRERLRREARAAAGLSHPGIATVYALEEIDDQLYIASEYVPGRTLRDEVAAGPLPQRELLTTAVEIAQALAAAHDQGVIHRDLKPENVIRTSDGKIKVLDFGLAYVSGGQDATSTRLTEPGSVLGTPGYISPEQLRGSNVDSRTDLFSFGVLLYELVSGAHPFSSSNAASTIARVLEAEPPNVIELSPDCPPALEQIIRKCLQKDPRLRYGSTRELVEALAVVRRDLIETGSRPAAATPKRADRSPARSQLSPIWWWQFHQVTVGLVYYLTLLPIWSVRSQIPSPWGALLFFSTVAVVGVAATLRFHLWFTSRFYRAELAAQRDRVFWLIRVSDGLFVVLLLGASGAIANSQVALTSLLLGIAVGSFIAFLVIEPATARAAFKRTKSRSSRRRPKGKPSKSGRQKKA